MEHSNQTGDQRLAIYSGRHAGWWIKGRSRRGRTFMWTWWPTKNLAVGVARLWRRLVGSLTDRKVVVEEL